MSKKHIFTLLGILFFFGGGYVVYKQYASFFVGQVACTEEAKLCPDGSYVGRVLPRCEFAACPVTTQAPPPAHAIDTSNWKTYRNEKYGFEVRYPETWQMLDSADSLINLRNYEYLSKENATNIALGILVPLHSALGDYVDTYIADRSRSDSLWSSAKKTTASLQGFKGIKVELDCYGCFFKVTRDHEIDYFIKKDNHIFLIQINSHIGKTDLDTENILSTFKFLTPVTSNETANWKTYRNEIAGYELKYPSQWKLIEGASDGVHWQDAEIKTGWALTVVGLNNPQKKSAEQFATDEPSHKDFPYQIIQRNYPIGGSLGIKASDPVTSGGKSFVVFFSRSNTYTMHRIDSPDSAVLDQILSTFKFVK